MAEPNGTLVGIGKTRNQYWYYAEKLVRDARDWANVVKLKQNLDNPETENSVWHVFRQYYDGDYGRLRASIRRRYQKCLEDIIHINELAESLGLQKVTEPMRLLELLLDYERRKDWLTLIERHRKACEEVSLQEVERESHERRRQRDERKRLKRERAQRQAEENQRRLEEVAEREFEAERQRWELAEEQRRQGLLEGGAEPKLPPELEEAIRKAREALSRRWADEADGAKEADEADESRAEASDDEEGPFDDAESDSNSY